MNIKTKLTSLPHTYEYIVTLISSSTTKQNMVCQTTIVYFFDYSLTKVKKNIPIPYQEGTMLFHQIYIEPWKAQSFNQIYIASYIVL
jgi:hypothetical protein